MTGWQATCFRLAALTACYFFVSSYTDDMHLGQRVVNSLSYLAQKVIVYFTYSYYQDLKIKYDLNITTNIYHSFDKASLRWVTGCYGYHNIVISHRLVHPHLKASPA